MNWKIFDFETMDFVFVTQAIAERLINEETFGTWYWTDDTRYAIYAPSNLGTPARRHSDYWRRVW